MRRLILLTGLLLLGGCGHRNPGELLERVVGRELPEVMVDEFHDHSTFNDVIYLFVLSPTGMSKRFVRPLPGFQAGGDFDAGDSVIRQYHRGLEATSLSARKYRARYQGRDLYLYESGDGEQAVLVVIGY